MVTGWSSGGASVSASVASAVVPCGTDSTRSHDADRLAGALDPQHDLDVRLVVLALVGEGHDELALRGRDAVRRVGLERQVAHAHGVQPRAVEARRRLAAVAAAAARRQRLAERVGDRSGCSHSMPGQELRALDRLAAHLGLGERRPG